MLSSTVSPRNARDCWYVRASPSRARVRAGRVVTSAPSSSTVPDVAAKSPAITLKSVVFPAPFGPRIARRSPGATSRSTSRTAWRPPKRRPTPRKRRVGSACSVAGASVKRLLDDLLRDDAVLDDLDLALPRRLHLHAGRLGATRRRARLLEETSERLGHVRHEAGKRDRRLPVRALDDLQRPLVLDRLAVCVEMDDAAAGDLVPGLDRPRQARLELGSDGTSGFGQALDQRPGRVVVVVDEAVGVVPAVEPREHLGYPAFIRLRGRRLQTGGRAEAADVCADQPWCNLGEVAQE